MTNEAQVMYNQKKLKKDELNNFKFYLLSVAKIKNTTADDYCKRIANICKEEDVDYDFLCKNIDHFVYEYTKGDKKELGRRSHSGYSGALKHLSMFVKHSANDDLVSENEKVIKLSKLDNKICHISLIDKDETLGQIPVYLENTIKDNRMYAVTEKIVELCLPYIYKNNPKMIFSFLESAGYDIKFED